MKDNRFIDLVNLYIDRQITAAETAELEAEIQGNPRRRAIYRRYCQMHRATTLVYESFRANAPEPQVVAAGGGSIARFERDRRASPWGYYAAGVAAAAACVALVFVQLNARRTAEAGLLAKNETLPAVPVTAVPPRALVVTAEPRAGLVSLRNRAAAEQDYTAQLAALRQEDQRIFANGQLQSARPPSLFDDGVFESQPVMPMNNPRIFRSRQSPAQPQAEFTAFQFQR